MYFQPLIDKVASKLNGWKGRLLSSGGHLILVRHVLQVMPIYQFAVMNPPKVILKRLERMFVKFLWGANVDQP